MKDETVPPSGLQLMEEAITALGGTKFTAAYFDEADHNNCINFATGKDGDLFDWMLAQTRTD